MRIVFSSCIAAWAMFFLATAALSAATGDQPATSPEQAKAARAEKTPTLGGRVTAALNEATTAVNDQAMALNQKALGMYADGIRRNPENANLYEGRGGVYADSGDYDKAIADYTEAIRLDPKLMSAYEKRAQAYEEHKAEHDKAIADYTEVIRLSKKEEGLVPLATSCYKYRARAYAKKGNTTR
jgi:tetratricopeptide (TPR) repeat protein